MTMIEDPRRQLSYLQQCLSSDKKPLGLFLGAGCPMAIRLDGDEKRPLIPDVAGITLIVRNDLAKRPDCESLLKIVEEHFAKDGRNTPTMEDMLTHIRALRAVSGKDEVRGLTAVTNCDVTPTLQEPIKDPAQKTWHPVIKVQHYWLEVDAMTQPMRVREDSPPYGGKE